MFVIMKNSLILLLYIFLFIPGSVLKFEAKAADWNFDSFYSTTHTKYIKSNEPELEVKWTADENNDWHSFFVSFSSPSSVTIDSFYEGDYDVIEARTVGGMWKGSWTKQIELSGSGSESYYFNISIVDIEGDPHPVSGLGPFYIDTEPPGSPYIEPPEMTSTANIILLIDAIDAKEYCISNSGYGDACLWTTLDSNNILWTVNEGNGVETTIYAQFKDDVGNISMTSATTIFMESSDSYSTKNKKSIPAFNISGIIFFILLITFISLKTINKNFHKAKY